MLEVGKRYYIYGKMQGMDKFLPVAGADFTTKRIHADVFIIDSESRLQGVQRELKFLNTQGEFEVREV